MTIKAGNNTLPCGCCETPEEALKHHNPPGQEGLDYRLGRHSDFKRRMLRRLGRQRLPDENGTAGSLSEAEEAKMRPLLELATRAADDPAIALIDSWAAVSDVLSFYQERIANEGFLNTAVERLSVLELARAIGYELNPGVAAGAYLAFTIDEADGAPEQAEVPAGTQVQSLPKKGGELPQTFETTSAFTAHADWNKLKPRLSYPQGIGSFPNALYLDGTATNLKPGDRMLLVSGSQQKFRRIKTVKVNTDTSRTKVTFTAGPAVVTPVYSYPDGVPNVEDLDFNEGNIRGYILEKTWSESDLQAFLDMNAWEAGALLEAVEELRDPDPESGEGAFAFRETAGIFGSGAPYYKSLPGDWTEDSSPSASDATYPNNWDSGSGWRIWKDSLSTASPAAYYSEADMYLDKAVDGLETGSWIVLKRPGFTRLVCKIRSANQTSLSGFAMSSKVTSLSLDDASGVALADNSTAKPSHFRVRKTTVFLKSEDLALSRLPDRTAIKAGDTSLTLDGMVLGLQVGQAVALSGEQGDAEGVERSEVLILDGIEHSAGFTTLAFKNGLGYGYKRSTVTINANVVAATHGETVAGEVLGSGDGAQAHQAFKLKKPPLTYTSAATASGGESTLEVRVDGIEWTQKASLYRLDPTSRSYTLRIDDDANASVIFGDGKMGARLPTGQQNVAATYRSGVGLDGEVDAGSLTLLKTRPFGVKGVTNPGAASGAANPEKLEEARTNAPVTVLTLDRIVSLRDYENFARAFAGIGKARAMAFWRGERQLVHITVADSDGDTVAVSSTLYKNLLAAIEKARDPMQEVRLGSFVPLYFDLEVLVMIDGAYEWDKVKALIEKELKERFSFEKRAFAQPVSAAEVLHAVHEVAGVIMADLEKLQKVDDTSTPIGPTLASLLRARAPQIDAAGAVNPGELLLINPYGITLSEKK